MKQRCNNPKHTAAPWYHDAGIRVCAEWNDSFERFQSWALENGYFDSGTIDRLDPDGDYSPENCRWITLDENRKRARHGKRTSTERSHRQNNGKFMVVRHPEHAPYYAASIVIKVGLTKPAAGEFIKNLIGDKYWEIRNYSIFVTDDHKVGDIVFPEKCRYYLSRCKQQNR